MKPAKRCKFEHSPKEERSELGENVYTITALNVDKTNVAEMMVWQDSYKLGRYVEWCTTQTLAVCQYNSKGNMLNSYIYETGNPCAKDTDCNCNCTCSKEEGLCIVQ
ncbi:hypothetical protein ANCCEY_09183 [Ancylostoma ceylanicum]|uniref:SCP domain-containing protein n=1 Tax=Ancylostoma ceylanicum TaxID=53326 RepID=A0A0D6LKQ2_9BILA|nr:hypothetical protein ANCCEY_09183 [Ancylostoma ceylanicum]